MPIYEFHCQKCERESEILVRSSHEKGLKCPHCGSTRLSKQLSVFASSASSPAAAAPPCGNGGGACGCRCGGGGHHH